MVMMYQDTLAIRNRHSTHFLSFCLGTFTFFSKFFQQTTNKLLLRYSYAVLLLATDRFHTKVNPPYPVPNLLGVSAGIRDQSMTARQKNFDNIHFYDIYQVISAHSVYTTVIYQIQCGLAFGNIHFISGVHHPILKLTVCIDNRINDRKELRFHGWC